MRIADIRMDGGTQPRATLNILTITEYADAMRDGATFPPVTVFHDGTDYWLADGFHRVRAAEEAGLAEIAADVRQGTRRDAVLFSVSANASHGLRRTNEDKRQAVLTLLNDAEWHHWNNSEIGRRCGVSDMTVFRLRPESIFNIVDDSPRTVQRGDTVYTMHTANIGRVGDNGQSDPLRLIVRDALQAAVEPALDQVAVYDPVHVCADCGEIFSAPVWHCLACSHHWRLEEPQCRNCYREQPKPLPEEPEPAPDKMAVHYSSDSPEWYTPEPIIARVTHTLGHIDLDPCSNSHGSPNVPAALHYTAQDDGLCQEWRGRVYMNPPYGNGIADWVEKLCSEYELGRVTAAVALVPARTDTAWFRRLREYPRCFVWGRLRFSGYDNTAPFPSMAVYLGEDLAAFKYAFGDVGDIYQLV